MSKNRKHICENCKKNYAFYILYGKKLCDLCLIVEKIEYIDPDYGSHISLPIKRIED